jgi:hypothetical protein
MESTPYRNFKQSHFDSYKRIEAILEKAGPAGVHRAYFLYDLKWSQHGARITEMNDLGWDIQPVRLPKSQWINGIKTKYVLRSKPLEVAPGQDWYVRTTGQERPSSTPADLLPLFTERNQ